MLRKASAQDTQIGRTLWLKDHGGGRAIGADVYKGPHCQDNISTDF